MRDQSVRSEDLPVVRPKSLSVAISAMLAAPAGTAVAQPSDAGAGAGLLEEVLVTARKRTESLQQVPESIQAISQQQLIESGLYAMEDYARFVPSMSYVSRNPGLTKIVFRGIADDAFTFIAEPSAALYLDEQPLTLNATPDPRMVDIERVEALSGPQGTLYGASAQAGVLRVVTNKPDPTKFDAWVDLAGRYMEEGDPSYDVSAMVNIPLSDTFAIRLVGFAAEEGGFIDNVHGTTPRFGLFENTGAEEDDYNDVTVFGGRISAKWFINDDWSATFGIVHQDTEADARAQDDPDYAGEYQIVRFFPNREFNDQDWQQYSLTIEGDLGFADFVSATSYFERDWTYQQDTSVGYASYFGTFCYVSYYGLGWSQYSRYCFQPAGIGVYYNDPIGYLQNVQNNSKFAQEFRLLSQGERFDWVAGFFYELSKEDWVFETFTEGYDESQSMANYLAGNLVWRGNPVPARLPGDAWWLSADDTEWEQWAVFGELTWHITDKWDATFGYRWFKRTMDKSYRVELPRYNLTDEGISMPTSDEEDSVPKVSLSYQITDNNLVYALYSEGFRPGGTNRNRGMPFFPNQFEADKLKNFELGTKNTFADGRVRLNATYFDMKWDDYQLEVVDPSNIPCGQPTAPPEPFCGQPWQKVVANVGKAVSEGLEVQLDVVVNENFTFGGNGTWLNAELDEDVVVSVLVPKGTDLPLSSDFKGSAYAQLDWSVNWGPVDHAWARLQWSYTGAKNNILEPLTLDDGPSPQIRQPSYDIGDLRVGVDAPGWSLQLFVNNITDERAVLFADPYEFDYFFGRSRVSINRPREFGVRFIKHFGE